MPLRRTPKDALGTPLAADRLYQPLQPYSAGNEVFNRETRLRGDHAAVRAAPELWLPADTDSETRRRLQVTAVIPTPVDHSERRPGSKPIPVERQAIASESFTDGKSGTFVTRGQVYRDDHPVVKANKRLFQRPAQPLEAA